MPAPQPNYDTSKPVLVTGATGFIAGWLVKRLLEKGFDVHAAVRDPTNEAKIVHLKQLADDNPGTLKLFAADLLNDGSYLDAMEGCSVVFHTASPFTLHVENAQRDLVDPALNGTRNILNSANKVDSVTRVVVTSSCAAICGDNIDVANAKGGVLTEDDWNTTSTISHQPYPFSKTQAEKAAWQMAKEQDRWSLVTINPAFVLGPGVAGAQVSESFSVIKQFGDGTMKSGVPPYDIGMVDVRDVAEAHLRAGFIEDAQGRHITFGEVNSLLDIGDMLREKFGKSWPIPTRQMPKWLVWLVGPLVDKSITRAMVSKNMGHPWAADNSKSKRALGIEYRPVAPGINQMFQQLVDAGTFK